MTTLTNRNVIVRVDGGEVRALCVGQSLMGHWIKVMMPEGYEQMVHSTDFVRMADEPSGIEPK